MVHVAAVWHLMLFAPPTSANTGYAIVVHLQLTSGAPPVIGQVVAHVQVPFTKYCTSCGEATAVA